MDEGRKRVLLIAASILAARKLAKYEKPCPAIEAAIHDAITKAEKVLRKIDERWPPTQSMNCNNGFLRVTRILEGIKLRSGTDGGSLVSNIRWETSTFRSGQSGLTFQEF